MPFTIVEKPFGRRPVEVDPITVDIIENALLNARREMDYVVFRSAMSTVIREQRDAYPLITDRDGRKVVGQFGSPIAGFTRGYFEDYVCDDGCGRGPYRPRPIPNPWNGLESNTTIP